MFIINQTVKINIFENYIQLKLLLLRLCQDKIHNSLTKMLI